MAEHTDLPWTIGKGKVRIRKVGDTHSLVAECYTTQNWIRYTKNEQEREANAQFIVKACNAYASDQEKIAGLVKSCRDTKNWLELVIQWTIKNFNADANRTEHIANIRRCINSHEAAIAAAEK